MAKSGLVSEQKTYGVVEILILSEKKTEQDNHESRGVGRWWFIAQKHPPNSVEEDRECRIGT